MKQAIGAQTDIVQTLLKRLPHPQFLWLNAVSVGGAVAAMGLNYLYQSVSARALGLADYGILAVLVGLWTILSIPASAITNVLSREMARRQSHPAQVRFLLRRYLNGIGFGSALGAGLGALLALLLGQALVAIVLAGLPFVYAMGVLSGYLQARERIVELTVATTGVIVLKLAGLLLFLGLGWGLAGATGALAASALAACALMLAFVHPKPGPKEPVHLGIGQAVGWVVGAQLLMILMTYLDLFFVRQFVSDSAAGLYNAAEITARILFSLAVAIAVVMQPRVAKMDGAKAGREGLQLLLVSIALLLPVFVGFQLLARPFLMLFFGPTFADSIAPFAILSMAMLGFGASVLMANYLWARGREKSVAGLYALAVVLQAALLYWQVPAGGLTGAAWASTGAAVALVAMLGVLVVRQMGQERKTARAQAAGRLAAPVAGL